MALPPGWDVGDAMVTPISRAMSVPLIHRWLPPEHRETSEWAGLTFPRSGQWGRQRQPQTEAHIHGAAALRIEVKRW